MRNIKSITDYILFQSHLTCENKLIITDSEINWQTNIITNDYKSMNAIKDMEDTNSKRECEEI